MSASETEPAGPERLHPRVQLVWAAGAVLVAALVLVAAWLIDRFLLSVPSAAGPALAAAVGAAGVALALARYRIWRFELEDDALALERGVITRVETAVPYVRIQHIDTQRGPIDRAVGLASVVVYTAGTRGSDVTVPGLTPERARRLRDRLRERAVASEPGDAV